MAGVVHASGASSLSEGWGGCSTSDERGLLWDAQVRMGLSSGGRGPCEV